MGRQKRHDVLQLRLFVAGEDANSRLAREALGRIAQELEGHVELKVVDVFEDYQAALAARIVMVPALVIESPPPRRVIVGSMADEVRVRAALGLASGGRYE